MKRVVNALRVPSVGPKEKSTTRNLNGARLTTSFNLKKNTIKNGVKNNSKSARMSTVNTTTKFTRHGEPKTPNTLLNGTEQM